MAVLKKKDNKRIYKDFGLSCSVLSKSVALS